MPNLPTYDAFFNADRRVSIAGGFTLEDMTFMYEQVVRPLEDLEEEALHQLVSDLV